MQENKSSGHNSVTAAVSNAHIASPDRSRKQATFVSRVPVHCITRFCSDALVSPPNLYPPCSQPTIFPSVQSAVTSDDLSTSSPSFNNDLISRLADAVTQRLRQENQPSLTALQSADTPVMEIPATIPSTPPCLPSHSLPALESTVQASHLATQPAVSPGEPSDPFISSSPSLDARVSEKIRAKIWNQEYVDFGSLLVNPIGQSRFQLTVSNAESGQLPSLCLEPAEKPRKITSIESWLSAFHVFVGVYTMKYPTESPALMNYGSLIRDVTTRGHNWRFYDENFRFIRQSHVSSLPWGTIRSELWLRSYSGTSTSKSPGSRINPGPRTKADRPIPYGFCFKFHRGLVCAGCHFKHTCFKCNGDHVATTCNFRASGNNNPVNKQPLSAEGKATNPTLRAEATFSRYKLACEKYFSHASSYRENVASARRVTNPSSSR